MARHYSFQQYSSSFQLPNITLPNSCTAQHKETWTSVISKDYYRPLIQYLYQSVGYSSDTAVGALTE